MGHNLSIDTIQAMLDNDKSTENLEFSDERLHSLAYHFDGYYDDATREKFGTTLVRVLYVPEYKDGLNKAYDIAKDKMVEMAVFLYVNDNRVILPREATWIEKYRVQQEIDDIRAIDTSKARNMLLEPTDINIDDFEEDIYPF